MDYYTLHNFNKWIIIPYTSLISNNIALVLLHITHTKYQVTYNV